MTDAPVDASSPPARSWTRLDLVVMALVTIVALVPRLTNLLGMDPFIDEAASLDWPLRIYELASPRTWMLSVLSDGRPPLYLWTIVPVAAVIDNGILAGRVVAVVADALCAVALYTLGRELHSRLVGGLGATLWALSAFPVFFARISVDDSLLTLMAALTTLAGVHLARRPTLISGALCGLCLALTVLTKTNGVLMATALVLAIVVLGRPLAWRAYLRPVGAAIAVGLLASVPLLLGLVPVIQQVSLHTTSSTRSNESLLLANATLAAGWLETLVGNRFLLLALAGAALALAFRQMGMVYLLLLCLGLFAVILEVTASMFARRLLLPVFPLYLLAGFAIERAVLLTRYALHRFDRRFGRSQIARAALSCTIVAAGLWLALGERVVLLDAVIRDPVRAELPGSERAQYFDIWFAQYGMGQIVEELRALGAARPVTVVVPPASRESRVIVPYLALRYYLRGDPRVRFVEVPALWRAQDLRDLRRVARDGPTYLVVNGSYTDGPGMPNDVPAYTHQLERRLAQDVPGAREIVRIPRPTAPNWLSLYRLDE